MLLFFDYLPENHSFIFAAKLELLKGFYSSWMLFIYTTDDFSGKQIDCPEGDLKWINFENIYELNLIGFIRELLPFILAEDKIIEGTITHDKKGNVIEKDIKELKTKA